MTDAPLTSTQTFQQAYGQLEAIAQKLKTSTGPSIDSLVEDVRAARAAYDVCRRRIAEIRNAVDAELAAAKADEDAAVP